jgi:hypothetical protein
VDTWIPGLSRTDPNHLAWVFSVASWDIKAYLNGVLVNVVPQFSSLPAGIDFQVGGYGSEMGLAMGEWMDEFRVYARALSDAEIVDVMNCTEAAPTPPPAETPTPDPTTTPTPDPTATATPGLDHFTCYGAGATSGSVKFPGIPNPPGVTLVDQFGASTIAVKKPKFLCAPTNTLDKDPTASLHAEHLQAYQIKNSVKPVLPTSVHVIDQFNASGLYVNVKKPSHLLVPTVTNLTATPPLPAPFVVDHYQCYQVTVTPDTPKFVAVPNVTVEDQFGSMTVLVKKPQFLCAPVDKNGEDPTAPLHVDHLMCYQAKQVDAVKFAKITGVFANNQFGPETLDVKKPVQLCVPALTNR